MKQRILYLLLYTVTILTLSACQDDNSFGTDFKPAISRYGSSSQSNSSSTTSSQTTEDISSFCPDTNHPHLINLGLSVRWACCNVGATSPADIGGYYAWGETAEKATYEWSTYKWCNGTYNTLTKYCTDSEFGTVDNLTQLVLSDDAAFVNMGSPYHTPTIEELTELNDNCTWKWVTGTYYNYLTSESIQYKGYKVTGSNGNSIFLPAAGSITEQTISNTHIGFYRTSSLSPYPDYTCVLSSFEDLHLTGNDPRYKGLTVRAVASATTR